MHSIFSDGELIPAELVRRAVNRGYTAMAITDHGDHSNIDFIIPRIVKACRLLSEAHGIKIIPGIELTHVPPAHIAGLTAESRKLGAGIVVVHGETIAEPVMTGTNRAALESGVDILAHPGLISEDDVRLAAKKNILLEISARKGHSLTNGHVARVARSCRASLILNTDSHAPQDLVDDEAAIRIALGAGLSKEETDEIFTNAKKLVDKVWVRE